MSAVADCIFCRIAEGGIPADILFDGGDTLFFRDTNPKAPVHIIGIPKKHLESLDAIGGDDHCVIGKLLHEATHVARDAGIFESGYRVITNVGKDAGQEVMHLHFHVVGGEDLGPLICNSSSL
ncbi:MAG TPA: histidine triad nucleotide-binding protein [Candidatus Andersenbacteria bacterium]|nr:histidine triad nucleotide-binding protein [Candidatus Andersenbacteria bacterium]